jgi:alpha-D-ribose 1-methylphosphonate 5-phosphate C-P lyase
MYQAQKVSGICVLEVMIYHVPSPESERYLCVFEVMIYHVPSPESERYLCVRGNDLLTFWAWYMVNHYL